MVKNRIKSELIVFSNCSTIELIEKLTTQFENFYEINIEVQKHDEVLNRYKITFFHDLWLDTTKLKK
jgi:hypothetical protein